MVYGTDFSVNKLATDVVVVGAACSARSAPVRSLLATIKVGSARKSIRVIGNRMIERASGNLLLGDPAFFESMPIRWENAYGGIDLRVPIDPPRSLLEVASLRSNGPGFYPRNPHGRGYFANGVPREGVQAPNLEDPERPLTVESMCIDTPRDWWRAPLPQCFMWMAPWMFPRVVHARGDAWFPGPEDDSMPEVAFGWLRRGYRSQRLPEHARWFLQEAAPGLTFKDVVPGTRIAVENMNPVHSTLAFEVPSLPTVEFLHAGVTLPVPPRLNHIVLRPNESTVDFVYGADCALSKRYAPGFHARIPLAVRVDGGEVTAYETPTPIREVISKALADHGPPVDALETLQLKDEG